MNICVGCLRGCERGRKHDPQHRPRLRLSWFAVLPVGPNKRPWTEHGVHSASTDAAVFSRWDWSGAACAVATGERVEVLDVDLRGGRWCAAISGRKEILLHVREGIDGFATLKSLGLDWERIETLTLCAATPSGGFMLIGNPSAANREHLGRVSNGSSKGKYVVVPPAPGRAWLNDLPIAEAPEELKRIVIGQSHQGCREGFPWPSNVSRRRIPTSTKVPKPLYFLILRLMPKAERRDQRRAAGLFNVVA